MRVLTHQPDHAKVLQQLGWLHHQPGAPFADQDKAVSYLTKSLETDGSDAQSWYLLGRAFMAGQRYNKAYEAYQQAVYRDGRNPTFWCSIGVLYYQINQYRDALDAYSRAIRLNPYISEVWYNLGSLYESCNNQITDAIDAYTRAADLDPTNATIKQRLGMLQNAGSTNAPLPPAPGPVDVHPSQYTAQPQGPYPPGTSPGASPRPVTMPLPGGGDAMDGPQNGRALPPPPPVGDLGRGRSPGPFRGGGGAPPPLQHVDETRGSMSRHAPLAPMEVDRSDSARSQEGFREGVPPRFDPAAEAASRRHDESPGSPRRRGAAGEGYAAYPPYSYGREREREEWGRDKERAARGSMSLGPSPRTMDRQPYPPGGPDIRRQPSPRNPPPDYRGEYGRPGESSYPYYPQDGRPSYPYDRRDPTPSSNGARHPSISQEDARAPSPAPSSTGGGRRRKDDEVKTTAKRATSKKNNGDKKKGVNRDDGQDSSPGGGTPRQPPGHTAPSRTVDEGESVPSVKCKRVD